MFELFFYSTLAALTLVIPLSYFGHPTWIAIGAGIAEFLCLLLIYSSAFVLCKDGDSCGENWNTILPALFATMNIGMIWPILAAYARQSKKDTQAALKENNTN